jgi:hypothetical protein
LSDLDVARVKLGSSSRRSFGAIFAGCGRYRWLDADQVNHSPYSADTLGGSIADVPLDDAFQRHESICTLAVISKHGVRLLTC